VNKDHTLQGPHRAELQRVKVIKGVTFYERGGGSCTSSCVNRSRDGEKEEDESDEGVHHHLCGDV